MGGDNESEGRRRNAKAFAEHDFFLCSLTDAEYLTTIADHVTPEFTARRPSEIDAINMPLADELALPTAHFAVGLRLPLWPEVRQVLKHYGVVPGQLTPNAIAVIVAFACYLREERIEFSLPVFRKLFSFRVYKDGTAYFVGSGPKVVETVNKAHYWAQKFLIVKGNFRNIPFSPVQHGETTYRPPALGGHDASLYQFFCKKNFEVIHLRRNLDSLLPVLAGEGNDLA